VAACGPLAQKTLEVRRFVVGRHDDADAHVVATQGSAGHRSPTACRPRVECRNEERFRGVDVIRPPTTTTASGCSILRKRERLLEVVVGAGGESGGPR